MSNELPFSQAAEKNKEAIADVLNTWIGSRKSILEIGSGTGQHAVYFAQMYPQVVWQCADQISYHEGLNQRIEQSGLRNLPPPLVLEAATFDWSRVNADIVFSANTAHIMPWEAVQATMKGVSNLLNPDGIVLWYGPFNIDGAFTSPSNADFDKFLKSEAPHMGIRDRAAMEQEAHQNGLVLKKSIPMPANNQILVFSHPS